MSGKWADLAPRLGSAVVMVLVGFGAIWIGGLAFNILVAATCGAMVWELSRMIDPNGGGKAYQMGLMTAVMLLICSYISPLFVLPFLLAPAVAGAVQMPTLKGVYLGFAVGIALVGLSLISLRENLGFAWVLWLICVVVATDVAGYFAGKMIGGAKLWPRVSPKKTWSGTVAGWFGAGLIGIAFLSLPEVGLGLVVASVVLSMASQAGDIAESALKRQTGVKDSSALIPGHGGVMDRFDGMLGAALMLMLMALVFGFPAGLI